MLVFVKERLSFLSMPKTGITAYQTALAPRADLVINNSPLLKHAPVYRYNRFIRPMFLNVCDAEMELMAVMREPVSWLSSWYRYRQRPFMKDILRVLKDPKKLLMFERKWILVSI